MGDPRVAFAKAHPEMTLRQIGAKFGVTAERIRQLCTAADYKHNSRIARRRIQTCAVPICDTKSEEPLVPSAHFQCDRHRNWDPTANPATHIVKDLLPGAAVRLKNHQHVKPEGHPTCNLHQGFVSNLRMNLSIRHDGDDLLVIRWPEDIPVFEEPSA